MKLNPIKIVLILAVSILFIYCDAGNSNVNNSGNAESVDNDLSNKNTNVYAKYKLPLPIDIFTILHKNKYEFNASLLNPIENASKYFTSINKAINLGFFSSDLAYCTIFEKSQESVEYFSIAIDIAHELDITAGYNKQILEKAYDNIENSDTLSQLASNSYWKTCKYLEENDKLNLLPFVIVGSWIESSYILSKSDLIKPNELLNTEIYKQKIVLENLVNYINSINNESSNSFVDEDVKKLSVKLNDLKHVFNVSNEKFGIKEISEFVDKLELIRKEYNK